MNDAIKTIGRRIYIIIEDLDRLTAKEIFEVLKLIDRNGNFCNTIFLSAYDKNYVNSVLKKELGHEVTQDFTDKYFDYELSLPMQNTTILRSYFIEYINKNLSSKGSDAVTKDAIIEVWNKEYLNIVKELGSIRHLKRFINIFMSRYPRVKNDVNIKDFLLLTLLRYKDVNVYNAIVSGDLILKGSSLYNNEKIIYLRDNYYEILKDITAWNGSKKILEALFPIKKDYNTSLYENYKRIRLINCFDIYFYDYYVGGAYYIDLIKLFNAPEDEEAFSIIDNMLLNKQESKIEDFLRSRTINWISNKETLVRLFELLIYADINRNINIEACIAWLLQKETANEAKKADVITSFKEYTYAINDAVDKMIAYRPIQFGFMIINVINSLIDRENNDNPFIFSHQKLVEIAEECQKCYYLEFGTKNWSYAQAFNLCKITGPKERKLYDYAARVELFTLMKNHSEDFAKNMITCNRFLSGNKPTLSLGFISDFEVNKIFPIGNQEFVDWLNLLSDKATIKVLKHIYEKALNNEYLQVPALRYSYTKMDVKAFSEAIDTEEKRVQTEKILSECNSNFIVDLTMVAQNTNIDIDRTKELVKELVKANKLPERYALLKISMEPLVVGDYVRLKKSTYDTLLNKLYYTNNIFRIISLDSKNVKIQDIDIELRIDNVEPIPIDGIADKDLYYDPIIMGSFVAPGQPIPVHNKDYSYYMEKMKSCYDTDHKAFYDKIKQNNCQFVHEVQHILRKGVGEDRLMLRHNYRTSI